MSHEVKELPYSKDALKLVSEKALTAHHDKLYAGYVAKRNEIEEALKKADRSKANHNYSEFRALKLEEVFNANGQILHELYFDTMRPPTDKEQQPAGKLLDKIVGDFGSLEAFMEDIKATAMAARGWAVTAYDPHDGKLHNFLADFHSHGGVWTATPILTCDVYEHAFFMDYGPDKKSYVEAWSKVIDWDKVQERFSKIS